MFCWVFWRCCCVHPLEAKDIHGQPEKRVVSNELALEAWSDLKFGMFIHWGIYSTQGGYWDGRQIAGLAEHLQRTASISQPEYARISQSVLSASLRSRQMGTTG